MSTKTAKQCAENGDFSKLREELANLHLPIGNEGPALENIADRLQGILETTEQSCESILHSIEAMLEATKNIRRVAEEGNSIESDCNALEEHAISALESCAFQDLTSQRVSKIVRDLLHVECSVEAITDVAGRKTVETMVDKLKAEQANEDDDDTYLLGPQNEKDAIDQGDIDAVFS